jgi:hypothetical protein
VPARRYLGDGTPQPPPRTRSLYLREDRILARVRVHLAAVLDADPSADALVNYLRSHDLEVTCTAMACSVDTLNGHAADEKPIIPESIITSAA